MLSELARTVHEVADEGGQDLGQRHAGFAFTAWAQNGEGLAAQKLPPPGEETAGWRRRMGEGSGAAVGGSCPSRWGKLLHPNCK